MCVDGQGQSAARPKPLQPEPLQKASLFGRFGLEPARLRRDYGTAILLDYAFGRGGILRGLLGRPDGPRGKFSAAIRAVPAQYGLCAVLAKSAFEAADHSISGFGLEILVAALTIGSEL
jgi:hypothetical protein